MQRSGARTVTYALVVVAIAALALGGCAALLGLDKNYELGDASSTDASNDALDEVTAQDGGLDANYCAALAASPDAGKIALCEDFDLGNPVGYGWTEKNVAAGSSLAIDSDAAISKPSSLLAITPWDDGGLVWEMAAIGYEYNQSLASKSVSVEADIRFDDANGPTSDAVQPIEIGLGKWSAVPEWRARINAYPDHAELEEYEKAADGGASWDFTALIEYFLVGRWVHVTMRVDLIARTVDVWFDSTLVLAAHPLKFQWPVGQIGELGVGNIGPRWGYQGPWSIRTDNVVFRVY